MFYYLTTFTKNGKIVEHGWMLAADDRELIDYAKILGYGIDIEFLGVANMNSVTPEVIPGLTAWRRLSAF